MNGRTTPGRVVRRGKTELETLVNTVCLWLGGRNELGTVMNMYMLLSRVVGSIVLP